MNRLLDFLDTLLGRRKGTKLILATLGGFDRMLADIERGLQHIDQEIRDRTATIQQEQDAILALNQVATRAAVAHAKISQLAGSQH